MPNPPPGAGGSAEAPPYYIAAPGQPSQQEPLQQIAALLARYPGASLIDETHVRMPNGRIRTLVRNDKGEPDLSAEWTAAASNAYLDSAGVDASGPGGGGGTDPAYLAQQAANLAEDQRQFDAKTAESQRQFDLSTAEGRRQFDLDYNRGIQTDGAKIGLDYAQLNQNEQDAVRQLAYQYYNSTNDANAARQQALATLIQAKQNGAINLAQTSGQIAAQAAQFASNPRDAVADINYRTAIGGATPYGSTNNPQFGQYQTALDNKFNELFGGVGQDLQNARQYLQQPIPQEYLKPIVAPQVAPPKEYLPPALNMPLAQYADNPNPTARALLSLRDLGVNNYSDAEKAALARIASQGQPAPAPQPAADPWAALRGYTPDQNQELIRYAQAMAGHAKGADSLMLRNPIVAIDTVTKQPVFTIAENGKELIKETKKGIKVVPQKGVSQKLDPRKQAAMVKQLQIPGYATGYAALPGKDPAVGSAALGQARFQNLQDPAWRDQWFQWLNDRSTALRAYSAAHPGENMTSQIATSLGYGAASQPGRQAEVDAMNGVRQQQGLRPLGITEGTGAAQTPQLQAPGLAAQPVSVTPLSTPAAQPAAATNNYDVNQVAGPSAIGAVDYAQKKKNMPAYSQGGYIPSSSEGGTNMNIHEPFHIIGASGHVYAVGGEDRPMQLHIKGIPSIEKAKKEQEKKQQEQMKGMAAGGSVTAPDFISALRTQLRSLDPQAVAGAGQALPDPRLLSGIYGRLQQDPDLYGYVQSAYSKYGVSPESLDYSLKTFQPKGVNGGAVQVRYA